MNSTEFRRRCLTDPWGADPELLQAMASDPAKQRFAEEVQDFDHALAQAMQVAPPPGLAARIKQRRDGLPPFRKLGPAWQMAMAACLVLAIGVSGFFGVRSYQAQQELEALRTTVLEHIYHEIEKLDTPTGTYAPVGLVQEAFGKFDAVVEGDIGRVAYVDLCQIRDHKGVHLIIRDDHTPVTVLYMDAESVPGVMAVADGRFSGRVIPAQHGSWAVVSEPGTPIEPVIDRLQRSVHWTS
jgi:hypothetical protein